MIKEFYQKGWTITAIAEETGFDRKTIKKYIEQSELPNYQKRKTRHTKRKKLLADYEDYILQRLKEGTTNCVVLLEEIRSMGYQGQMTILRDFVRLYRQKPNKQSSIRYETPPGLQAQMDWAELGERLVDGRSQKLYVFVMVLGFSRMKYMEVTTTMNLEQLMKCHMNAFSYFNGIPKQILYDNMKTVVIKHSPAEIRFNRTFEEFLAYYGVVPKACKPARPQTKGKVESAVGYLKKNFMQRKLPSTLSQMNESLQMWLDQTANKKPNQTTKESPLKRFEAEQDHLLNWNQRPMFPIHKWTEVIVGPKGAINYEGKLYSVPIRFNGRKVKVKQLLDHHIDVFDGLDCIASHPLITGKATSLAQIDHYQDKEKKEMDVTTNGLATRHNPLPEPEVEQRSLQVYEEQSKAGETR